MAEEIINVNEIVSWLEIKKYIGEEKFKEYVKDIVWDDECVVRWSRTSYDDHFDVSTISDFYEEYKDYLDENKDMPSDERLSFKEFAYDKIYENCGLFYWDEWAAQELEYIKSGLIDRISMDYEELPEEVLNSLDDFYMATDFIEFRLTDEIFPDSIHINLILSTANEWNVDMSSISEMYKMICDDENIKFYSSVEPEGASDDYIEELREDFVVFDNMLYTLIKSQGYSISDLYDNTHDSNFLTTVSDEMLNNTSIMSGLTVLASVDIDTFDKIVSEKTNLSIQEKSVLGLFNPWSGSGSILEIELEKPFVISPEQIHTFQIEAGRRKSFGNWTVDDVYGLVGSCWKEDAIKTTDQQPMKVYDVENTKEWVKEIVNEFKKADDHIRNFAEKEMDTTKGAR